MSLDDKVSHHPKTENHTYKLLLMFGICFVVFFVLFSLDPIEQDVKYHDFADQRMYFGIPNALNVLSNVAFFFVGIYGLHVIYYAGEEKFEKTTEKVAYWFLLNAVVFISFGSGYYHWNPTTGTLFWDRLPMTVAFMSLTSALLTEQLNLYWGRMALFPLIILGMFSVMWWSFTELAEGYRGDLRMYAAVQLAPVLLSPFILTMFVGRYTHTGHYMIAMGLYVVAKVVEFYDHGIYYWSNHLLSGHSAKHLIAAAGIHVAVEMIKKRSFKVKTS